MLAALHQVSERKVAAAAVAAATVEVSEQAAADPACLWATAAGVFPNQPSCGGFLLAWPFCTLFQMAPEGLAGLAPWRRRVMERVVGSMDGAGQQGGSGCGQGWAIKGWAGSQVSRGGYPAQWRMVCDVPGLVAACTRGCTCQPPEAAAAPHLSPLLAGPGLIGNMFTRLQQAQQQSSLHPFQVGGWGYPTCSRPLGLSLPPGVNLPVHTSDVHRA